MRANEFITELFQPGKKNWEWARLGRDEASAFFNAGGREYLWQAFTPRSNPKKWEIQFRLLRKSDVDPDDLDLFGTTGTGNSAEVMSTAVDITRAFLKDYGLDNVEEITFNAKEDSRIGLYAKMIKRLLPDWDLHSKKDPHDGMVFTLTDRRAYDNPENKLNEVGDTFYDVDLEKTTKPTFGTRKRAAKIGLDEPAYKNDYFTFTTADGNKYGIRFSISKLGGKNEQVNIVLGNMTQGAANDNDLGITGTGDAVKVFSTVKNLLAKYLSEHPQINIVTFMAKKDEPSRVKLYSTMAKQFSKWFPEFSEVHKFPSGQYDQFMIKKPLGEQDISEEQLDELSFLGSECTKDCSGHRAGYEWSKRKGLRQGNSWSPSFNKGAALAVAGK